MYDVSKFNDHPGGIDPFLENPGEDASEAFMDAEHSASAKEQMKDYLIGTLKGGQEEEVIVTKNVSESELKKTRMIAQDELAQHCVEGDTWLLIHGKIYDVSKFNHPGGKQLLIDHSGRDTSQEFDDIGHTKAAYDQMKGFYIGDYKMAEGQVGWDEYMKSDQYKKGGAGGEDGTVRSLVIAGLFVFLAALLFQYFFN